MWGKEKERKQGSGSVLVLQAGREWPTALRGTHRSKGKVGLQQVHAGAVALCGGRAKLVDAVREIGSTRGVEGICGAFIQCQSRVCPPLRSAYTHAAS
jgi:hypothetical protein